MKKLMMMVMVLLATLPVRAQFAGGDGSAGNPYLVATAEQLDAVRNHLDANFRQTADIDLDVAPWNETDGWVPIGVWEIHDGGFTGHYDGQEHVIRGMQIRWGGSNFVGLFAAVAGTVENLTLENVNVAGNYSVGALVGWLRGGSLHYCQSTGTVQGNTSVGGLAGEIQSGGTVLNCSASGTVMGEETVGGLVGKNGGEISESDSGGTAANEVPRWNGFVFGGLVGENTAEGRITRSFSTAAVAGHLMVGGLVGLNNRTRSRRLFSKGNLASLGR